MQKKILDLNCRRSPNEDDEGKTGKKVKTGVK